MLKVIVLLLVFPALSGYALAQSSKECDLCVSGITEFKVLYGDSATQSLISLAVEEICSYVPIPNCYDYIDRQLTTFTTEVLSLDPNQLCSSIGMCHRNDLRRLDKSVPCDFCEFIGDEINQKLINKDNANKILDIMDGVCSRLGPFERICKEFVDNEIKSALYKAIDMLDFDEICKKAHLCTSRMNDVTPLLKMGLETIDNFGNDDGCNACKDGLGLVKKILNSPQLKDLVHIGVSELCDVAAADTEDAVMCKNITIGIIDSIIGNLLPLFSVDSLCQQAGACPALSATFIGDSEGCTACIDGLELVKMVLTSDEIMELVNIAINETCKAIGGDVETCDTVTAQILDNIIKNLVTLFDPEGLCQQSGACPATFNPYSNDITGSRSCAVCKDIFSLGRMLISSNETKEIVGIGIDTTCELIGVKVSFCKRFVKMLTNKTLDYFMSKYIPENICSWMRICKAKAILSFPTRTERCQACLDGLEIIQMLLKDPELLDLVHIAVNETCMAIGGDVAACESAVDDILDPLIENLVKLFNPQSLCEQAGACLARLQASNSTCQACLDFARLVSIVIRSNNFRDLIHVAIGAVCQIGGVDVDICTVVVTDIVDPIIDGLVPLWVPEEICHHSTEMCPENSHSLYQLN